MKQIFDYLGSYFEKHKITLPVIAVALYGAFKYYEDAKYRDLQLKIAISNQNHETRLKYLSIALQPSLSNEQSERVLDFLVDNREDTGLSRWADKQLDSVKTRIIRGDSLSRTNKSLIETKNKLTEENIEVRESIAKYKSNHSTPDSAVSYLLKKETQLSDSIKNIEKKQRSLNLAGTNSLEDCPPKVEVRMDEKWGQEHSRLATIGKCKLETIKESHNSWFRLCLYNYVYDLMVVGNTASWKWGQAYIGNQIIDGRGSCTCELGQDTRTPD